MSITGSTNTCKLTANIPFYQSGNTESNSSKSVIKITNMSGLDLTSCFNISSHIDTVTSTEIPTNTDTNGGVIEYGDGVTTTPIGFDESGNGLCENILIVSPITPIDKEVECTFTGVTLLETTEEETDGLVLVTFSDGSTSLNVHPDCCTAIDSTYVPEIGSEHYYVCRWRQFYDNQDCDNYTIDGVINLDENDYVIFNEASGGTTTIVPSAQCCYNHSLEEVVLNDGIRCKEIVEPACSGYRLEGEAPDFGYAEFTIVQTDELTTVVPTIECCTINGLSAQEVQGGFSCYNSLNPPTVSITLDSSCCEEQSTDTRVTETSNEVTAIKLATGLAGVCSDSDEDWRNTLYVKYTPDLFTMSSNGYVLKYDAILNQDTFLYNPSIDDVTISSNSVTASLASVSYGSTQAGVYLVNSQSFSEPNQKIKLTIQWNAEASRLMITSIALCSSNGSSIEDGVAFL